MSNMTQAVNSLTINGSEYVLKGTVTAPVIPGKRAVMVIDRGWIVAGDVTEENGRIKLGRPVHVRSWEGIGFDGMVKDPTKKVNLKSLPEGFDMPKEAEIFRVWVSDNWGL